MVAADVVDVVAVGGGSVSGGGVICRFASDSVINTTTRNSKRQFHNTF